MKKFLSVMLLAIILIFVEGSQAEAREVYVGRYSDGSAVYLLTETIVNNGGSHSCRVRAGYDYLDYRFYWWQGQAHYQNSEGYSGRVYGGASPVAAEIYNYIMSH